jgi:hypothetical protein
MAVKSTLTSFSPWATGEALTELIADGVVRSTDLTAFDPARLRPLDPAMVRSSGRNSEAY